MTRIWLASPHGGKFFYAHAQVVTREDHAKVLMRSPSWTVRECRVEATR